MYAEEKNPHLFFSLLLFLLERKAMRQDDVAIA